MNLEKYGLRTSYEVQDVRSLFERCGIDGIQNLIYNITEIKKDFENPIVGRLTAQYLVDLIVKSEGSDYEQMLLDAERKAKLFHEAPKNQWMFVVSDEVAKEDNLSNQEKVDRLYSSEILNNELPISRKVVIEKLIKEIGLPKTTSSTYLANSVKKFGLPKGGWANSRQSKSK